MLDDTDFNDVLNSDDDEFFMQASASFLDCEKTLSEPLPEPEKSNIVSQSEKSIHSGYSDQDESPSLLEPPTNSVIFLDSKKSSAATQSNLDNISKVVPTTPIASEACKSISVVNNHSFTPDNSYIDNRFTPGFTPKAKKRKFAGPAGLLEYIEKSNEENPVPCESNKVPALDVEFEHIVSSQFSPEHLSLASWQKLQRDVSSSTNLHSTAKHYSIQRVLNESSKKKPPKHMVVPVLCVLVKKISNKESISIFMDDTGEVNGKIDSEVLSKYKEYITEGTALILKNVTFLCNVLILKVQNIVSMYMCDGTMKHIQNLESILETSEPLKPINCECLKVPHMSIKSGISMSCNSGIINHHRTGCLSQDQSRYSSFSNQKNAVNRNIIESPANKCIAKLTASESVQNPTVNKNTPNYAVNTMKRNASGCVVNQNLSNFTTVLAVNKESMRSDAFVEALLSEDDCMDEFDELLGNLDEKSFLGDM